VCDISRLFRMSATTTTTTRERTLPHATRAASVFVGAEPVDQGHSLRNVTNVYPPDPHSQQKRAEDNPRWWPTLHRRIPNYRRATVHPRWSSLTDSLKEDFMINMMFLGCYLLNVSSRIYYSVHPSDHSGRSVIGFQECLATTKRISHTASLESGE
jgi:hypothetical protein